MNNNTNTLTFSTSGVLIQYQIRIDNEYANCQVIDSYQIISRDVQKAFINHLFNNYPLFKQRSVNSYIREWRAHNTLYRWGIMADHSKDCDLNTNETKFRKFCYFFLSLIPQRAPKVAEGDTEN